MLTKKSILDWVVEKKTLKTRDLVGRFGVSRQYASGLLAELVGEGKLTRLGSTRNAVYTSPNYAGAHSDDFPNRIAITLDNENLEEHKVLDRLEKRFSPIRRLPENIRSIFIYAFSEMLNNAIEHSESERIIVEVSVERGVLSFVVNDFGIGVFRNIMRKRELASELEAIQDLLKGKTTTMPRSHSGEGIFFTSKAGDLFVLDSFGDRLVINNVLPDVFVQKPRKSKRGTKVTFRIPIKSDRHLSEVFREFTDTREGGDYGFSRTEIKIKLYTLGGVHISRSQARRVLSGLEKFKTVVFDFDKVPVVGQAFADEIFRVFHTKYPGINLQVVNMEEGVKFMVDRVRLVK